MTTATETLHQSASLPVPPQIPTPSGYLGPAEIFELNAHDRLALIKWNNAGQPCRSWAVPAIAGEYNPRVGDTVLVLSQNLADFYIIGLLRTHQQPDSETQSPKSKIESVRSPRGELLFEYDSESGKARVHVPVGDLEFVAPNGSISFHSARDIRFGAATVNLLSRWGACLGIFGANGQIKSAVTIDPESLKLKAPEIKAQAEKANLRISETQICGNSFTSELGTVRLLSRRLELVTETLIEKARNAYRTAEQLSQTQAGRLRMIVRDLCHLKARKAILKADEDFRIDGEKVHLG